VGDIVYKVISATENSNKFQKARFWKEKSVENGFTLGPTAQATLVVYEFEKYSGTRTSSLVPHFRADLYTRKRLVYEKGDTRPTHVFTIMGKMQISQGS